MDFFWGDWEIFGLILGGLVAHWGGLGGPKSELQMSLVTFGAHLRGLGGSFELIWGPLGLILGALGLTFGALGVIFGVLGLIFGVLELTFRGLGGHGGALGPKNEAQSMSVMTLGLILGTFGRPKTDWKRSGGAPNSGVEFGAPHIWPPRPVCG